MGTLTSHVATVSVLGLIEVRVDGHLIDLGTPRQRAITAALALSANRPVTFHALVDRVWGDAAPATAVGTLQRYVASLRRALEPDLTVGRAPSVLCTSGPAYVLCTQEGTSDVEQFEHGVNRARRLLSRIPDQLRPTTRGAGVDETVEALGLLDDVLRLWRGEPYADLGDHDGKVVAERTRLRDLREGAIEQRLIAMLALGRHAETIGDLEAMTDLHPLHERWWALRAVGLFRCGRQADALRVLGTVRELLADELGVDPSPPLQQLYSDILQHDPSLEWRGERDVDPAPVSPIGSLPRAAVRPPLPRWRLVGRDHEAAALRRLVLSNGRLTSWAALVTGEAGVGKTRLVQEAMHAAYDEGSVVAVGRCSTRAPALWPFRSVLNDLGLHDAAAALEDETVARDFHTWQRVIGALKTAVSVAPLLIVLEDVQWADTATLQLAAHLVGEHDVPGLTLTFTRRTHEGSDARLSNLAAAVARADGVRIDLGPLSQRDAQDLAVLANPTLGDPVDVAHRSGGIPYFVAELALSDGMVSGALRDVVIARTMALDEKMRIAVTRASLIGDAFTAEQFADKVGSQMLTCAVPLREVARSGLIHLTSPARQRYAFNAPVTREIASELIGEVIPEPAKRTNAPTAGTPLRVEGADDAQSATHPARAPETTTSMRDAMAENIGSDCGTLVPAKLPHASARHPADRGAVADAGAGTMALEVGTALTTRAS